LWREVLLYCCSAGCFNLRLSELLFLCARDWELRLAV
jgi:hypothetical protein